MFSSLLTAFQIYRGLSGCWGSINGKRLRFWVLFTGFSCHQLIQGEDTWVVNFFASETSIGRIVVLCIHLITSWGSVLPIFCMALTVFQSVGQLICLLKGKYGKQFSAPVPLHEGPKAQPRLQGSKAAQQSS